MTGKERMRFALIAGISGLIIGFCYVAGASLEAVDTVDLVQKSFYLKWIVASIVAGGAVTLLWKLTDWLRVKKYFINAESKFMRFINRIDIPIWGYMAILLVCWLPALLSVFPGAFAYDAYDEWHQVYSGEITAHHPVLHVLLLGGLTEGMFRLTGSYNVGICIYTVMQMIILAWVFAYTLNFLKERSINKVWRICSLLFYCFSPVVQLFAISATKDVIFTAGILVWFISLLRLLQQKTEFWEKKRNLIIFALSALVTMIMRNNGLYIVILTLFTVFMFLKENRKQMLRLILLIFIPYFLYIGPFYRLMGVEKGGIEEMLSVPIQQIARVHHYEEKTIPAEDLEILYKIIPKEKWDAYRVSVSDFVKSGFVKAEFENYKADFLKIWLQLGKEHPLTYINSFLLGTVDFWYPHSVMDGYRDVYGKSSYFDYRVIEPGTEVVLLPKLHEFYEYLSWDKEAQKIPGVFLILSPGWYFMIAFVIFMYLWEKREYYKMIPMGIMAWNMITVFLGPIALVRYVLILFFIVPLYAVILKKE